MVVGLFWLGLASPRGNAPRQGAARGVHAALRNPIRRRSARSSTSAWMSEEHGSASSTGRRDLPPPASANRTVERCAFALETALQNRARWARDPFVSLVRLLKYPCMDPACGRTPTLTARGRSQALLEERVDGQRLAEGGERLA